MRKTIPGCALLVLGIVLAGSAHAQWKWRDASGLVHYSDQPPPVSVPAASIQSMRGGAPQATVAAAAPTGAATAPADAARGNASTAAVQEAPAQATNVSLVKAAAQAGEAPAAQESAAAEAAAPARPRTPAERLAELRKQQADKEAALRKKREQEQIEARAGQWCEDLKTRARILETGRRVAQIDSAGEQSFVTDEDREAQLAALRRDIQSQCKGKG